MYIMFSKTMEVCNKGMFGLTPSPPVMVKDHIFTFFFFWTLPLGSLTLTMGSHISHMECHDPAQTLATPCQTRLHGKIHFS